MADAPREYEVIPNKRGKSDVWKYFGLKKRISDGKVEENIAVCNSCNVNVKYSGGTSNLSSHIRIHHKKQIMSSQTVTLGKGKVKLEPEVLTECAPQCLQQTITHVFEKKKEYSATSPRAMSITNKIARFIVRGLRPYSIVDDHEFRELLSELDVKYRCPSRYTFANKIIPQMYEETKRQILIQLKEAEQVALTTDGWTSCATDSYLTITSCHINKDWEIVNLVLQTRVLNESHTAQNIADELQSAVQNWRVNTTVGFPPVTTDNAANITKAVNLCKSNLHVPCLAHTLNLAVQKSLKVKEVSHILGKMRKIVGFFHRSPPANQVLRDRAVLLALPNHDLIIDCVTCWNSAFDMVARFLEMREAIITALVAKETSKTKGDLPSLTDNEISLAEEVVHFLKPMKDMTTLLCSEGTPTASVIMPLKHHLLTVALRPDDADSATIKEMKEIMTSDLQPRYVKQADLLYCASAVDPRFKHLPFLSDEEKYDVFKKVTTETARLITEKRKLLTVKTEPTESIPALPNLPYIEENVPVNVKPECKDSTDITTSSKQAVDSEGNSFTSKPSLLEGILGDVFIVDDEPAQSPFDLAKRDVDRYFNDGPIPLSSDSLGWWKVNQLRFPILAVFVKMMLCVPATSVPSERAFSTAGDIITPNRASLKPDNLDMLLFLKKNLK
ncbi:E3 SUMO-protein ligase ZBED1-like [Haliotis asinina]|uniref:E3 SUMO-protein ligase ZBED1-like n=1 Tax=Haliotis asinina TaxID=109174 RepID=UPI003531DB44